MDLNILYELQNEVDDNLDKIANIFNQLPLKQKFICVDDGVVDLSQSRIDKNVTDAIQYIKSRSSRSDTTSFYINSKYENDFLFYVNSMYRGFYKINLLNHTFRSTNDNLYVFLHEYAVANKLPLVRDEQLYQIFFDDLIEWCKNS